jgi:adenine-specific DNA-methyltransferase
LRNCAYWKEFEKEKIIFQEIVQEPCFIFNKSDKSYFCLDTARIITGMNLKYLLCVLNSNLFFYTVKKFYGGGGLGSEGIRMKHTFFEQFKVLELSESEQKIYVSLCDKILLKKEKKESTILEEKEINNLIYELYELTETEINIIENKI